MGRHVERSSRLGGPPMVFFAWLMVSIPLTYGLYQTLLKAAKLFTGG
jgi:hypothetical protein